MESVDVLFLGANPEATTRLALQREVREIRERLRRAELRNLVNVEDEWAVRDTDLHELLLRNRPTIVHFSGHGSRAGELLLENTYGAVRPVSAKALANLFGILKHNIRCVVLNACFSEIQARAIGQHIDFVIGMTSAIADKAAIAFAAAFYQAIGYGETIETAFELGRNQIDLSHLGPPDLPRLIVRGGTQTRDIESCAASSATLASPVEMTEPSWRPLDTGVRSRPNALLASNRALVMCTDLGEWRTIGVGGELRGLPATAPVGAVVVDSSGTVTISCWEASIKQLRRDRWTEIMLDSAALALAVSPHGVIAGDAAGGLTLVMEGARAPMHELVASTPIVELRTIGESLLVLDAAGALATTARPQGDATGLAPVDVHAVGRPHTLGPGPHAAATVVIGDRGMGLLDATGLGPVVPEPFVRAVTWFSGHDRACVVTDTGTAWIVDGALAHVARIRIAEAHIEGCAPTPDGCLLAWTADGDLYAIEPSGAARRLEEGNVVLAAPDPEEAAGYVALHWTMSDGVRLSRGRTTWS
jgi:CHAT domain